MQNSFAGTALSLLAAGYAPIPIVPGTKRPALAGWQRCCNAPLERHEIKRFATSGTSYGVGVALGSGLVAIDIDIVDEAIVAAIRSVVPASPTAKRGRKGRTDFYLDPTNTIRSCKLSSSIGMLVEVLAHGNQTVVPPSLHPETGLPYHWLGPQTLANTPLDKLPVIVADIGERLASALKPWRMSPRPELKSLTPRLCDPRERERQRRYAEVILTRELKTLATMKGNSGRNHHMYRLVCRVGRWVHAGILPADRLAAGIMNACLVNGLVSEDGPTAVLATVESGLRKSVNDALPNLDGQ